MHYSVKLICLHRMRKFSCMKRTHPLPLLFLLLLPFSAPAQQTARVSGAVKTTENEALPHATVRLVDRANTTRVYGGSTDEEGKFSVAVPRGNYSMEITYIGYRKQEASVQLDGHVVLPDILLAEDSQLMDEVVITAKSITYHADGYIAEIAANPFYKNYDLDQILILTPGTNVVRDEISLYGKRVSKVYVDGREVRMQGRELMQYLRNFNGRNVRRMEVVAAGGVEEDASSAGSSIIKITTVKLDDGGMLTAGQSSNHNSYIHYNTTNINTRWRTGRWSTYLTGSFVKGNSLSSRSLENFFHDSGIRLSTESSSKGHVPGNILSTLGIGYDFDARNLVTVEGSFRSRRNRSRSVTDTRQWGVTGFEQTTSGISHGNNNAKMYNLSLNYTHLFNEKSSLVFTADRLQNDGEKNQENDYAYISGDSMQYRNRNKEKNLIHTAAVNWERSLREKDKLTAGIKYTDLSTKSNMDNLLLENGIEDEMASYIDRYDYTEQVYALFSKYALTHSAVNANVGVRLEHAVISPRSAINPERNRDQRYTGLFPEVAIHYDLHKEKGHRITLQYNRSIGRPSMQSLNPLLIQQNEYSYTTGNPLLKPSYSNLYTSRFTLFDRFLLNISYTTSRNRHLYLGVVDPENDIIYTRPENGMKSRSLDIYMEYPLRLGSWGQLKLNGSYSLYEERFEDHHKQNASWDTGFSGTFRLPYDINVMADLRYTPSRRTLYAKHYSSVYSNVIINKLLMNRRLTASLMFGDIFNMIGGQRSDSFFDDYSQKQRGLSSTFTVMARVSYTFNWGNRSAKIRRTSAGNTPEQGRISSEN